MDPFYWYFIIGLSFTSGALFVIIPVWILIKWKTEFETWLKERK